MLPSRIFFNDFLDDFEPRKEDRMMCDIYEENDMYHIEMDAPGYDKKDISISLEDGNLVIEATKEESKNENKKYLHRERKSFSSFKRSFYLGDVCEEDIKAEFKDGILKISVPKEKEQEKSKKMITID